MNVCQKCGLGQTDIPRNFDISAYYPDVYYGKKNQRFNGAVEKLIFLFRKFRARFVQHWSGKVHANILDIGCGRGIMLSILEKSGWRVEGIELSTKASEFARTQLNLKVVENIERTTRGPYDVITLWHVLEHLQNPYEMLDNIKKRLLPGGLLIIEVPHFSSWQAQIDPKSWIYLEAPRHTYHFSKTALQKMFFERHFQILSISTFSLEYGYFGMLQSLLNQVTPKENFLFYLLRNPSAAIAESRPISWWISLMVTFFTVIPLGLTALMLESIASLVGRGGCLRMVLRVSEPASLKTGNGYSVAGEFFGLFKTK